MARSWAELLGDEGGPEEAEEEQSGFFSRLRDSLGRSRRALTGQLAAAAFDPDDDEAWERLEEALIAADVGVPTTAELVRRLEARDDLVDGLEHALVEEIAALLGDPPRLDVHAKPSVLLFVVVNGTGKTTTIAKLGRVVAGRLEGAPHETLLVIDATTGQNGVQQARLFGEAVEVTGVVLTKLDGSAKGGIAVAIAHELELPVKLIGVGERLDDLRPFDPNDFARALLSG